MPQLTRTRGSFEIFGAALNVFRTKVLTNGLEATPTPFENILAARQLTGLVLSD